MRPVTEKANCLAFIRSEPKVMLFSITNGDLER